MNGVTNSEREKLDARLRWLERGLGVAGGLVVLGLAVEYGPEITESLVKHQPPSRDAVGGLLITIGVLVEVVLGLFISSAAKRVQMLADSTIAETNERAKNVDLARAKLETNVIRRTASRLLNVEEEKELEKSLSEFAGQKFTLRFDREWAFKGRDSFEQGAFLMQLSRILSAAGWVEEHPFLPKNPIVRTTGMMIFVLTAPVGEQPPPEQRRRHEAGFALHRSLAGLLISSQLTFQSGLPTPMIIGVGLL